MEGEKIAKTETEKIAKVRKKKTEIINEVGSMDNSSKVAGAKSAKEAKSEKAKTGNTGHERIKTIPDYKIKTVNELADMIKKSKTVLIASTRGLPSSQFHDIKKKMRGTAEIRVAKKSLVIRAISKVEKGALQNLKAQVGADVALFFSNEDPFELAAILSESKSVTKARAGDIAPEDIIVEAGPTELVPGPAISELSAVGLKVMVEKGKLAIRENHVIAKAGDKIKENVAGVMSKLGIAPMKVGFEPLAAYDSVSDKVYTGLKIDKKAALENLQDSIKRGLGFAVNVKYVTQETIKIFIYKAVNEEKALSTIAQKASGENIAAGSEEKNGEVKAKEPKKEEVNDTSTKEGK